MLYMTRSMEAARIQRRTPQAISHGLYWHPLIMSWVALNCPQCSAPLPRIAIWRAVKCGSCGALITKTESMVMRDSFRQALNRARQSGGDIQCAGDRFQLVELLGTGEISHVYRARRV